MVGRESQQCFGHSDMVIEVALGVECVVLLLQHTGNQFLGCGFTVGAGYSDDACAELAAMMVCEFLQCLQHVINQYGAIAVGKSRFIDNGK